jgi:transposase-like protein
MKSAADSKLRSLIRRVVKATAERGERVKLANRLGVPRQNLNDWLSGRKSPGGETTLRLLAWVTAAESKKQNARRSGINTTPDLTRSTHSTNENRKSGPIKS